jgi:hypothetical protein
MFFLASWAAFCRSAKLGSLNPLIERALSLSWFAVRRSVWCRAGVPHTGARTIRSSFYSRARREAIQYPLTGAMSREN